MATTRQSSRARKRARQNGHMLQRTFSARLPVRGWIAASLHSSQ
jgi:hypothetical protein